MKKLFERGKQFLQEKLDERKQESSDPRKIVFKKIFDDEKQCKLALKILEKRSLPFAERYRLKNSPLFKKECDPIQPELQSFFEAQETKFDFLSDKFQTYFKHLTTPKQDESFGDSLSPLLLICIISFHHKKGPIIEFMHPQRNYLEVKAPHLLEQLTLYAMPDAIHNKNEDCIYFNLSTDQHAGSTEKEGTDQKRPKLTLFGVSYFKQISVTEEMRAQDAELTRSHLQKSLCVISIYPLYGYLMSRLAPTTLAYFSQCNLKDYSIIVNAFESINAMMSETAQNIQESELFYGTSPKTLLFHFKEKTLLILKALLLEKKILVFSLHSQACSIFILSLLSLIPGMLHFRFESHQVIKHEIQYRDFGLPFRLFDQQKRFLALYFTIQDLDEVKETHSFLIGTTNQLIRQHKNTQADLVIDLDRNHVEWLSNGGNVPNELKSNSAERAFIENLVVHVQRTIEDSEKSWKSLQAYQQNITSWEQSNDYLRFQFYSYFRKMLTELALFIKNVIQLDRDIEQKSSMFLSNNNQQVAAISGAQKIVLPAQNDQQNQSAQNKLLASFAIIANQNIDTLKRFNFSFLTKWAECDNLLFWRDHYNSELLPYHSENCAVRLTKDYLFPLENSDLFVGRLANGKKEGHGVHYDPTTQHVTICENYSQDLKEGPGTVRALSSFPEELYSFDGTFHRDKYDGANCKLVNAPYFTYIGGFQSGLFHGNGSWSNFKATIFYEGEFCAGKRQGMGKFRDTEQGICYIGFFADDVYDGKGQLVEGDGSVYNGDFKNAQKCGFGEYVSQKETYVGEFRKDLYDGQGTLTDNVTKFQYQGVFNKGRLDLSERIIVKYANGDVYSGPLNEEYQMHGRGILSKGDGDVVQGIFEKGELIERIQEAEIQQNEEAQARIKQSEEVEKIQEVQEGEEQQNAQPKNNYKELDGDGEDEQEEG